MKEMIVVRVLKYQLTREIAETQIREAERQAQLPIVNEDRKAGLAERRLAQRASEDQSYNKRIDDPGRR